MSIATFAGILAQTQAADSRCISCAAAAALAQVMASFVST
jgi:hypothetical protein